MLKNLTIKTKLVAAFIAVALIAAFVGYLGWSGLQEAQSDYEDVAMNSLPSIRALGEMSTAMEGIQKAERSMLLPNVDAKERETQLSRLTQRWNTADAAWKTYSSLPSSAEEQALAKQFYSSWGDWKKQHDAIIALAANGTSESLQQAQALSITAGRDIFDKTQQLLDNVIAYNEKQTDDTTKTTESRLSGITLTLVVCIVVGVALALFLGVFLSMTIAKGIGNVVEMIKDIAQGEGDLTKRLQADSKDEIGELSRWFNTFVNNLHSIIEQVANSTDRIASASEELSATTEQFSTGADAQLGQSQQIASAMHEMSASILEVAKNAQETANAAKQAAQTANTGSQIVGQTIEGIKRIAQTVDETAEKVAALGDSSSQIGEIIGVIDDIADQTNLLALNAAIEAARAGEQGRGFAVVADEVRKLAERTTKATKEIAAMITSIQKETQQAVVAMESGRTLTAEGVEMANQAESALGEIVQVADRVGGMVTLIATAAEEQSSASEQINASVENITAVIRQTGEGARQSAKATEELAQQALDQQSIVGKFKLANSTPRQHLKVIERKSTRAPLKEVAV